MLRTWLAATTALAMVTAVAAAQTPSPTTAAMPGTASESGTAPASKAHAQRGPVDRTETHIKSLHDRLHITAAQEPQWAKVTQVMRTNASSMEALIQDRSLHAKTMTAVEDLRSYEKLAGAHEDGLKTLIPVFQTLYDGMSPEQRKLADEAFRVGERHAKHAGKS